MVIDTPAMTYIRNSNGEITDELTYDDTVSYQAGSWLVDLHTPVKTYIRVEGPFSVTVTTDTVEIETKHLSDVTIGVRTYRRHPTTTITTTENPSDIASTISHLSAGLETRSPERSFPTLRNHPPAVEVGEQLSIPSAIEGSTSPVTISHPYTYSNLYAVAPLAYYLDATLTEGDPAIHVDGHGTWELPPDTFSDRCAQLLKQCVLLDCLTRTEGLYPTILEERVQVDSTLDIDWKTIYSTSFANRTATYLDIEYTEIEDVVPTWHARGYVPPQGQSVEYLPHFLDQLTPIEAIEPEQVRGDDARRLALQRFRESNDVLMRSGSGQSTFDQQIPFVDIPTPPEREALWVGESIPFGANHLLAAGIQRYHEADQPDDSEITVTLVCNDSEMTEEIESAEDIYGARENVRLRVDAYRNLTTEQLAKRLTEPSDLFHFVGHASTSGLHCPDGVLSPATVDSVGTRAFFLNACSSYLPGRELIEAGAIGGVVTLSDVNEQSAQQVGVMTANLLSIGFSLRNALWIAREQSVVGSQYICVGMDSLWLTHPDGGGLYAVDLTESSVGWRIRGASYPSLHVGIGSMIGYPLDAEDRMSLVGGSFLRQEISDDVLKSFLEADESPVRYDGEWTWSDQLLETLWET
ncbi:hypothetical protein [Halosegnis longus]|nr:hypothetical protein [Halosegnis longus]